MNYEPVRRDTYICESMTFFHDPDGLPIRVTTRPSYYRELAAAKPPEESILEGKVAISFRVAGVSCWQNTKNQKIIHDAVAAVLGNRGLYHRHTILIPWPL